MIRQLIRLFSVAFVEIEKLRGSEDRGEAGFDRVGVGVAFGKKLVDKCQVVGDFRLGNGAAPGFAREFRQDVRYIDLFGVGR